MRFNFAALRHISSVLLVLSVGMASLVHAQDTPPAADVAISEATRKLASDAKDRIQSAQKALDNLRASVARSTQKDADLASLRLSVDEVGTKLDEQLGDLKTRLALVEKRLETLGAAPEDGTAEDPQTTADRKRLDAEKAALTATLAQSDALKDEVTDVGKTIAEHRLKLFQDVLFRRTPIEAAMIEEAYQAAVNGSGQLFSMVVNSLEFMWKFKRGGFFLAIGLSFLAGLVFLVFVRRRFAHLVNRDTSVEDPTFLHRLSLAIWSTLVPWLTLCAFALTILVTFISLRILREDILRIFASLLVVMVGVYFVWRLSRAIFAPKKPAWRLVPVTTSAARTLVFFSVVVAALHGLGHVFTTINEVLYAPVVLTIVKSFVSAVLLGLSLIFISFIRPLKPKEEGGANRPWPASVRFLLVVIGLALIAVAGLGYTGLAQFAASQIVVTGAIGVTMYLGFVAGHAVSRHNVFAETGTGRYLGSRFEFGAIRLDQIGLMAGLLTYIVVILIGLPLVMLQWGFRGIDIWAIFVELFTEIQIGSISISLVGIVAGVFVFIAGLFLTKWFQRWLDGNVLERSEIDTGVRNSINTGLGYLGVAVAGVIGVSAAGINLSSLALVAGALSLGIGFGLQTIVQNFVSGLILLVERPFKVGDWIVSDQVEGFVRRISVRATEIETFRQQAVIVPNSQLINAAVGNWTHRNKLGRSEIPVGVSYDSDPRKVIDIMKEIADAHPLVLTVPEPHVEFVRFGDSSLDFELRVYLADLFTGLRVRNDLRLSIFERFKEEGIEIPFPQRDVNLRFVDDKPVEEQLKGEDANLAAAARLREEYDKRRVTTDMNVRDIDALQDDRHDHGPGSEDEDPGALR